MQNWMLPKITDYWDQRVQAIDHLSRVLKAIPSPDSDAQTTLLQAAIIRHADFLTDKQLTMAAVAMVDDLYKAVHQMTYLWDNALERYLTTSAGTFFEAVSSRGYQINYLIDNSFDDLSRPTRWYPQWFSSAQIAYICPEHYASEAMKRDGVLETEWPGSMSKYIQDGRATAVRAIDQARRENRHFVFLTTNSNEECKENALGKPEHRAPGTILICRSEAPIAGSGIHVTMPALLHP